MTDLNMLLSCFIEKMPDRQRGVGAEWESKHCEIRTARVNQPTNDGLAKVI